MFYPLRAPTPSSKLRFGDSVRGVALLGLVGVAGCSGAADPFEVSGAGGPELDSAELEARVEIERSRSLDQEQEESARGEALAQFALIPASWYESDRQSALARAGLRRAMPAVGQCEVADGEASRGIEPGELEPVELLAAGDVRIEAGGHITRLSLHGFPLTGVASGVLYTTRDRAAEPLPNAARYSIEVEGSSEVPQLSLLASAPAALEAVTVAGEPLSELEAVSADGALEVAWEQGTQGDIVYVDLSNSEVRAVCAFADEQGGGSVPGEVMAAWPEGGELRLSVHRVHEELSTPHRSADLTPELAAVVRFDFAVHRTIEAQPGN